MSEENKTCANCGFRRTCQIPQQQDMNGKHCEEWTEDNWKVKRGEKMSNEKLIKLLAETAGCLQDLVDLQNGPPLLQHKQEWELTMKMAEEIIAEVKNE